MDFAIFNVADICVVVGGIAACVYYVFSMRSWKERGPSMSTLTRTADRPGERADAFLARVVPDLTRSAAQRLLEAGAVRLAGRPVRKNYRTAPGDVLEVDIPAPQPVDLVPRISPLDIVYEDGDVIVVNKPVGMVVHPAPGHSDGTLVNALLYHCGNTLSGINGTLRPGIVHRIDRDTSGLIIAAKNDRAHLSLAAQLQDHSLSRVYEAVAVGGLREDCGTVDAPIGRHPVDRKRMAVDRQNGREAVTHWRVLARYPASPMWSAAWRRTDPPDPGPPGLHRPPSAGRCGLRQQKAGARPGRPVPARPAAAVHPSLHWTACGAGVSPSLAGSRMCWTGSPA